MTTTPTHSSSRSRRNGNGADNEAHFQPIRVPPSAFTLAGFRRWATSPDFPPGYRVSFLGGELFIDMSPEELETHNRVKAEIGRVIGNINVEDDLGVLNVDRTLLTNTAAGFSTEPDVLFATWRSLKNRRVRQVPRIGHPGQFMELAGCPDWVLEIVSEYTEHKDTQDLPAKYHKAGIPEYWVVDARGDEIHFQILARGKKAYNLVPQQGGWQRSKVFRRLFRLQRKQHALGPWVYTLHAKS